VSGERFEPIHWVGRFVRSIRPSAPSPEDLAWAGEWMSPAEAALFDGMDDRDRSHSIGVARKVASVSVDPAMLAAALLHDVGKSRARLGLVGRVVATLVGVVARDAWLARFAGGMGLAGRVATYLDYPALGRTMLTEAGSDPLVAAWAAEHHRPPAEWSVPAAFGHVLADADR
jgi:hypothetical protein